MKGGYQIIDMGGVEVRFDISSSAPLDEVPIKKQGIYEIFKSVGSKPILIENLNITFVETSENDEGEIVVNFVDKLSRPFFAEYQKKVYNDEIILDIYPSAVDKVLASFGAYYDTPYVRVRATDKDILSATM
jgi:hypothetical protein